MKKVLLYSGGLDSWLLDKIWKPDKRIYVDTQGSYSEFEKERLPSNVEVITFPLGQYEVGENKYVPLRNLYFLMLASNYGDEILFGATAGDWNAKDKSPEFLDLTQFTLNYLLGRRVRVVKDFIGCSKDDLLKMYLKDGGSVEEVYRETFSCFYSDGGKPCMNCKPCLRKFITLYNNGYEYSEDEKQRMLNYMLTDVLDRDTVEGTYYTERNKEGSDMIKAINKLFREFGLNVDDFR